MPLCESPKILLTSWPLVIYDSAQPLPTGEVKRASKFNEQINGAAGGNGTYCTGQTGGCRRLLYAGVESQKIHARPGLEVLWQLS